MKLIVHGLMTAFAGYTAFITEAISHAGGKMFFLANYPSAARTLPPVVVRVGAGIRIFVWMFNEYTVAIDPAADQAGIALAADGVVFFFPECLMTIRAYLPVGIPVRDVFVCYIEMLTLLRHSGNEHQGSQ